MNDKNINKILNSLSDKLGASPQELEAIAKSGDISRLLENESPEKSKQIEEILSNPKKAKSLLESPQAQALIKLISGE